VLSEQITYCVLVLRSCGQSCWVNYSLDLPAGIPVNGETSTGAVSLSGVGEVEATISSGAIDLDGVAGAVDVDTPAVTVWAGQGQAGPRPRPAARGIVRTSVRRAPSTCRVGLSGVPPRMATARLQGEELPGHGP
jgi:hypothetical protein